MPCCTQFRAVAIMNPQLPLVPFLPSIPTASPTLRTSSGWQIQTLPDNCSQPTLNFFPGGICDFSTGAIKAVSTFSSHHTGHNFTATTLTTGRPGVLPFNFPVSQAVLSHCTAPHCLTRCGHSTYLDSHSFRTRRVHF
jgi:hypothetical protein